MALTQLCSKHLFKLVFWSQWQLNLKEGSTMKLFELGLGEYSITAALPNAIIQLTLCQYFLAVRSIELHFYLKINGQKILM